MRVEKRRHKVNGKIVPRGLVLIAESKEESKLIDDVLGSQVDDDGMIAETRAECWLSDGYGEHYIYLHAVVGKGR